MAGVDRPLLCAVVAAASLAGCSYDWTVDRAAAEADAGADVGARADVDVIDAGEAGGHDSSVSDVDSGAGPRDTGAPPTDGPPSCAQLTQELLLARGQAIGCDGMNVMACKTTVLDECGCDVVVGGDPTYEANFASAVMAFKNAHCSVSVPVALCPATCPTVTHVCLAVDGGASYACYQ
jgi:hypothetical protein